MKTKYNLSVIIPTYNRPIILKETIESVLAGDGLPDEIIIVDQSPTPFNPNCLDNIEDVQIKVIRCEFPSLTHARNVGVRSSNNDIVLFCDDDILLNRESIGNLMRRMNDSSVALVAAISSGGNSEKGSVVASIRRLIKSSFSFILGLKKPWRHDGYVIKSSMRGRYPERVDRCVSTEWAMGFFFCLRKSLIFAWNIWFDENLTRYAYPEDLDFSLRFCQKAKEEGYNCCIDPSIFVKHLASSEWRTPSDEAIHYYVANRRYLAKKIFPHQWWYRYTLNYFDMLFALYKFPSDFQYSRKLIREIAGACRSSDKESMCCQKR